VRISLDLAAEKGRRSINVGSKDAVPLTGDRRFESRSLQRRVTKLKA